MEPSNPIPALLDLAITQRRHARVQVACGILGAIISLILAVYADDPALSAFGLVSVPFYAGLGGACYADLRFWSEAVPALEFFKIMTALVRPRSTPHGTP